MKRAEKTIYSERRAAVLIISMIFVLVFSMFAISMAAMSGSNVEVSSNQHKINSALTAAQSGLEYGRFLACSYVPTTIPSDRTEVTVAEADQIWSELCSYVQANAIGGAVVSGSGNELVTSAINFGATDTDFKVRFYRYDDDPCTIRLEGIGTDGQVIKRTGINITIRKDTKLLEYAVASMPRVIVTGDSTIDGDIYSAWDQPRIAPPFELGQDSTVNGTLNTVVSKSCFDPNSPDYVGYTLEGDKVQGTYEDIKYNQAEPEVAGFDYRDYNTDHYKNDTNAVATSTKRVNEYFPHKAGDYTKPQDWSSRFITRYVYENQTFTNVRLPKGRSALFKNCTFKEVFFVEADSHVGWGSKYTNVRFENCNFNGIIVTSVVDDFDGPGNVLYFTGSSLFDNNYMEEATILAPNFNVNIGNTKELEDESESVLTGLVIGGIVDVRGNANVDGTILSMYEPPVGWFSGMYGTNVGFSNENSEGGVPEDAGTIYIHPDPTRTLPLGMKSNITLVFNQESYSEH